MKRLLKYAILLLLLFPRQYVASSQALTGQDLAWKNVSVQEKRMSVYSIFTDSRGIVWLGTNNGLFFYDGVTTHSVSDSDASRNPTYAIIEYDGSLFLGTGNGLVKYTFRDNFIDYVPLDPSPGDIRSMMLSGSTLWMGSVSGIFALNLQTGELSEKTEGLPHPSVYSLLEYGDGVVYAGTYQGLARLEPARNTFERVPMPHGDGFVNSLLADENQVYVGTADALYSYNPQTGAWATEEKIAKGGVKCLAKTENGHLLVGTDHGLFDIIEGNARHFYHDLREDQTLSNSEIWCVQADNDNNIWAGHEVGFSVTSFSPAFRTVKLSTVTGSGEGNDIHNIHRDRQGNLWLGGTNGLIRLTDGKEPRWYMPGPSAHSLSHVHIRDIKEDSAGTIWLPTDGGINRYNAKGDNFDVFHFTDSQGRYPTNWAYAIEEDGDDYLAGGYLSGLHVISKARLSQNGGVMAADLSVNTESPLFRDIALPLNNNLIHQILKDSLGNLWILCFSDDILIQVMADGQEVCKWDIGQIAGAPPSLIAEGAEGRIWCAFKGGVVLLEPEEAPRTVYFPKTDADEGILTMAAVGDDVWVSTVSNIWQINGNTLEADLLPIRQETYKAIYEDPQTGLVYLGGNDVLAQADPVVLAQSALRPSFRMIISRSEDGTADLQKITPGEDGFTVPFGGSLTLLVSTLDYSPDASPRFVYKLASSPLQTDGGWIVLPENYNTISLQELKPGSYFLLLKTAGSPEEPYALPIKVKSPWYLTWWAFLLYVIGIAAILEAVRRIIRRRKQWLLELRNKLMDALRIEVLTQGAPIEAQSLHEKQLAKITRIIEDNISDPDLNVSYLCEKSGMAEKQLYRLIKKYLEVGPSEHIRNVRLGKATELLARGKFTVAEICYMVGFRTPSYFTKCFQEKYGVKPSEYKKTDNV